MNPKIYKFLTEIKKVPDISSPPIRMFTKIKVVQHTAERLPMNCK